MSSNDQCSNNKRQMDRWNGGISHRPPRQGVGVRFLDPSALEKCAEGNCLCNLLQSIQSNDWETVIKSQMRRVSIERFVNGT